MKQATGFLLGLALVFGVPLLSADDKPDKEGKGKTHKVKMKDNKFDPAKLEVEVGDSVVWVNLDEDTHNAKSVKGTPKDLAFGTEDVEKKGEATKPVTFKKTGKVDYVCTHHEPDMKGTITVVEKGKGKKEK